MPGKAADGGKVSKLLLSIDHGADPKQTRKHAGRRGGA